MIIFCLINILDYYPIGVSCLDNIFFLNINYYYLLAYFITTSLYHIQLLFIPLILYILTQNSNQKETYIN